MKEFFGVDMTLIMFVLLGMLGVALATVAFVFIWNRVMFMVGVRNIPRRRAQTTLIIIGLMLSTLIISAAFSVGDTADYSISNTAYDRLHSVDETVVTKAESGESDSSSLINAQPIDQDTANDYIRQIKDTEGVDGALAVMRWPGAATNETKGQSEPLVLLFGVDPTQLAGFESDFVTTGGQRVNPGDLESSEIYANESAADELDLQAGDVVTLFVANRPSTFTVKDIVKDRLLTGAAFGVSQGFVMSLERLQTLSGREGQVDTIAISNDGGVRDGLKHSKSVTERLNRTVFNGANVQVDETKRDFVDIAADISSAFTTIFIVLGLFSIAAGLMLIFLIFVMLAAERKVEMGMVRAVGTKRRHLVQMFVSEGMAYNVGAAAVGAALGIGVAYLIIQAMARLFAAEDLSITFHVTPRSLVIAYSIGVVLTFLTVLFSSWRIGYINIVSAIRDIPEPPSITRAPERRGLISTIARYAYWLLIKPQDRRQWAQVGLLFVALAALVIMTMVLGSVATWLMVIGIFATVVVGLIFLFQLFQVGAMLVTVGAALMVIGLGTDQAGPFGLGLSAFVFGIAMVLAQLRFPARPVYTGAGAFLLVTWLLLAGGNTPFEKINQLDGDIEMFFISGISMVLSATFLLVYNADIMLGLLTFVGGFMSSIVPSIKTAVAYPLSNKFRTGMTIAMISLVMFALVMMSTMNGNFDRIFSSDDALGNYQVVAQENPGNPIDDLKADLAANGFDTRQIVTTDRVKTANSDISDVVKPDDDSGDGGGASGGGASGVKEPDLLDYTMLGASDAFIEHNGLKFQNRARGLDSDQAVWDAMLEHPDYAVVDAFAISSDGGFGSTQVVDGIEPTERTFDPIPLVVQNSATGERRTVQIVGVLSTEASGLYSGIILRDQTFDELFPRPESSNHYVQLTDGADAGETAKGIERTLLRQGVQADSLRKLIDDMQAQSRGFLYLIQGFMGIGLFVGIAAVGVIAFRTVVERRQQIGMLRAIGYTKGAIALSFLMESSFTALLGITSGIGLGLLLAYQLVQSDEFVPGGVSSFYIPWLQIIAIGGFAFLASLIMTIIPSRQASSIPIADALRYE